MSDQNHFLTSLFPGVHTTQLFVSSPTKSTLLDLNVKVEEVTIPVEGLRTFRTSGI
jgi:hypothetical protein